MKILTFFSVLLTFFLLSINVQAQPTDARVLSVTQGVIYNLGGKSEPLAVKMDVPIQAELKSDATGKAQLIFPDDSTLTIAPETTITLSEYSDIEDEENILLDLAAGTARIITGETNRRNKQAFTVNTPQASIGIRGTLVTIQASGDVTRVYLSETSGLGVSVRNLNTGKVMELRKPGTIINVGANFMEERKAQKEEAANFNAALRGKSINGQKRAKALADAEKLKKGQTNLAIAGELPPASLGDPAQLTALDRSDLLTHPTLAADNTTVVVPAAAPIAPQVPDNPLIPGPPVNEYFIENYAQLASGKFSGIGTFNVIEKDVVTLTGEHDVEFTLPAQALNVTTDQFTLKTEVRWPHPALSPGTYSVPTATFNINKDGNFSATYQNQDDEKCRFDMKGKFSSDTTGTISEGSDTGLYSWPDGYKTVKLVSPMAIQRK